jgi:putative addiction module component (TIGR02574 family)
MMQDILKLSVPERILMVEAIWDSITENGDTLELSDDTKQILDERLESHAKNPEEGHRWPDVKARIKGQF